MRHRRRTWAGRARTLATLVLAAPLLAFHRCALWLDELLFPSLRDVRITQPLFIVGVPRSGTTFLHRLVAEGRDTFTTFPLWELVLAPALCQKHVLRAAARWDRRLGAPLRRALEHCERRLVGSLDAVHSTSLQAPEEDYLGLLPFGGCFLSVLVWPHRESVWKLARLSEARGGAKDQALERRLLRAYRGLLARHLKFRGEHLRVLSKNPSFTSWVAALREEFADARFVGLRRRPSESLASQLSSLRGGFAAFGHDVRDARIVDRFAALYEFYWRVLEEASQEVSPGEFRLIEYGELCGASEDVVTSSLRALGYDVSDGDRARIRALCDRSRSYRSKHSYELAEFGLEPSEVDALMKSGARAQAHRSGGVRGLDLHAV